MNTVPLQNIEMAEQQLTTAYLAINDARETLGEHMVSKSYLAQARTDVYHARLALAGEIRGRERLGEKS